ncbi:hypothetical protein POX_c04533 [Penicillium oxalicum]|uniref:hypothetical protein n=1 Tax=Penicillium oxalicum TaxID=69781 RepID=UPI0020B7053E|nr:hypothetical protein POX_c04533 [Penicillium oxalicum]KAI2791666.1 hypothetical protein POX_c04533 [Penicillium oxalicum]
MSPSVSQVLHDHLQLCKWQDKLEFLCFVLCTIFEGLKDRSCECNQTLDLLQFVKKIITLCEDSHGRLRQLVPENELSQLKSCLYLIKPIHNLAAHHVPAGNGVMKEKQAVFDSVIAKLEATIQKGAKTYQVHQQYQPLKIFPKSESSYLDLQFSPVDNYICNRGHFAKSIGQEWSLGAGMGDNASRNLIISTQDACPNKVIKNKNVARINC